MNGAASGTLLAQLEPAVTTAVAAFTATLPTEITLIVAQETAGGTPTINYYHEDTGGAAGNANMIERVVMTANQNYKLVFEVGSGIMIAPSGILYVQTSVLSTVTFSIYGHTARIAERVRGLTS